jgi:hypothetical protein
MQSQRGRHEVCQLGAVWSERRSGDLRAHRRLSLRSQGLHIDLESVGEVYRLAVPKDWNQLRAKRARPINRQF